MWCPLTRLHLNVDKCPATDCMYNREGDCRHQQMTAAKPAEWLDEQGLKEEATKAAKKVCAYVYTDRYVQWSANQTLYTIKPIQIKGVVDAERFSKWPLARETAYAAVKRVLAEVEEQRTKQ